VGGPEDEVLDWKRGTCAVINAIVNWRAGYFTVLFGEQFTPDAAFPLSTRSMARVWAYSARLRRRWIKIKSVSAKPAPAIRRISVTLSIRYLLLLGLRCLEFSLQREETAEEVP
jgi:hypothetical protein